MENKEENKEFNSHEKYDEESNKNIFTSDKKQLYRNYSFSTLNPKILIQKKKVKKKVKKKNNNIKEDKNGNENNEINDKSDNLNINEIINQKNKEKEKPTINNTNKNNNQNNTKKINEKEEKNNKIFGLRKIKSSSNLNVNSSKKPNYLDIFDKINIFNSILITFLKLLSLFFYQTKPRNS